MMKKLMIILAISLGLAGCQTEFLEVKRDVTQEVPTSLDDFDLLLDNLTVFNHGSGYVMSSIAAEEFQLSQLAFDQLGRPDEQRIYLWLDENYVGSECMDWNYPYQRILYCNIILEGLAKLNPDVENKDKFDRIKGEALFHRANAEFMLSQQFAAAFGDTENSQFGIPLIHNVDPTLISKRSTVEETYSAIERNLIEASLLLPEDSDSRFTPSKIASLALLARFYLVKGSYLKALEYSEKALMAKGNLINYSELNVAQDFSFGIRGNNNPEIIFYDCTHAALALYRERFRVNEELISMYGNSDLRKNILFRQEPDGGYSYKGSYTGNPILFTGLATDELYFIAAESAVRIGEVEDCLGYMNEFLKTRFIPEMYQRAKDLSQSEALDFVLMERRKSLPNRGLRWGDIRRLTYLENQTFSLRREMRGEVHELKGRDKRLILLAPNNVIERSDVIQVPR